MAFSAGRLGSPVWRSCNALRWPMDLATSRRDDRAQGETEFTFVDESELSSQRATESFGNEQRRLKPDSGLLLLRLRRGHHVAIIHRNA